MADEKDAPPPLQAQVTAVELAYLNARGGLEILRGLVDKRKRDPAELKLAELNVPNLRQAWLTMKFIEANAEKIRSATKVPDPGDPF